MHSTFASDSVILENVMSSNTVGILMPIFLTKCRKIWEMLISSFHDRQVLVARYTQTVYHFKQGCVYFVNSLYYLIQKFTEMIFMLVDR